MRMTDLPQRTQRFFYTVHQGSIYLYITSRLSFVLVLILGGLLILARPGWAATPTPGYTDSVQVIVHLLDANDLPLVGLTVNLMLNRYVDTIEEIQAGSCITNAIGSCSITVDDPPRLRSGKIEGFIDLGTYGRQLIGWKEDTFEIILQLYSDGKLATVPAPLDAPYEGQTEQPTDAPLSTPTTSPAITVTSSATTTALPNTATPVPPTVTATILTAVTNTSIPVIPTILASPTPTSSSQQDEKSGWTWIGLGVILFVALSAAIVIYYRQHKPMQSG